MTQIPWDKRKGVTTPQLVGDFFMKTGDIKEGLALAFAPPAIFGLGTAGGAEFYIRNRGEGGPQALAGAMGALLGRLHQDKTFVQVNSLWKPNVPQLFVDVDREKAKSLGVRSTRSSTRYRRRSEVTTSTTSTNTAARGRY